MPYNISNSWPDRAYNETDLFYPYWLQFPPPSDNVFKTLGTYIGIISVVSVSGNALIILGIIKSRTVADNIWTINIAISDLLSPLTTYHMFVVSSFHGLWQYSKHACRMYSTIQGCCGLVSICSLACLSIEKYAVVAVPDSRWAHLNVKKRWSIVLMLWVYCVAVMAPPFIGVGDYVSAGYLITCCFEYLDRGWATRLFIVYLYTFGFIIPFIVIMFAYTQMIREARRHIKQVKRVMRSKMEGIGAMMALLGVSDLAGNERDGHLSSGGGSVHLRASFSKMSDCESPRPIHSQMKSANLFLIVICLFCVGWLPYGAVALIGQFGPKNVITPLMAMIPSLVAKTTTIFNPCYFMWKNKKMRQIFGIWLHSLYCDFDETVDPSDDQFIEQMNLYQSIRLNNSRATHHINEGSGRQSKATDHLNFSTSPMVPSITLQTVDSPRPIYDDINETKY